MCDGPKSPKDCARISQVAPINSTLDLWLPGAAGWLENVGNVLFLKEGTIKKHTKKQHVEWFESTIHIPKLSKTMVSWLYLAISPIFWFKINLKPTSLRRWRLMMKEFQLHRLHSTKHKTNWLNPQKNGGPPEKKNYYPPTYFKPPVFLQMLETQTSGGAGLWSLDDSMLLVPRFLLRALLVWFGFPQPPEKKKVWNLGDLTL